MAEKELISFKSFNSKIRNYLRDYLVYQYKEGGSDFKYVGFDYPVDQNGKRIKGKGNAVTNFDKEIDSRLLDEDTRRLYYILNHINEIIWKYNQENKTSKNRYIQLDSRSTIENPFFSTYRYCERSETSPGYFSARIFAIILQLHLSNETSYPISIEESECIFEHLKKQTIRLYTEALSVKSDRTWDTISARMKNKYAELAIKWFLDQMSYQSTVGKVTHIVGEKEVKNRDKYTGKSEDNGVIDYEEVESIYDDLLDIYIKISKSNYTIVFEEDTFALKQNNYLDKDILYDLVCPFYIQLSSQERNGEKKNKDYDSGERMFRLDMAELVKLGWVIEKKEGKNLSYALNNCFLRGQPFNNDDFVERFVEMVAFFSRTYILGEVGGYILDRFPKQTTHIRYKHDYPQKALNGVNNIDIMFAINNECWLFIQCRNASSSDMRYQRFLCYPLCIKESVNDGRQYLVFYHPGYRSVSAIRVDFIDEITICRHNAEKLHKILLKAKKLAGTFEPEKDSKDSLVLDFENDKHNAYYVIDNTWGTSFKKFKEGNVKDKPALKRVHMIINYDLNETYIKDRIHREFRNLGQIVDDGSRIEFIADIIDPYEVLQWARSFTKRVVLLEFDGKRDKRYITDTDLISRAYSTQTPIKQNYKPSNIDKMQLRECYNFQKSDEWKKAINAAKKSIKAINFAGSLFEQKMLELAQCICEHKAVDLLSNQTIRTCVEQIVKILDNEATFVTLYDLYYELALGINPRFAERITFEKIVNQSTKPEVIYMRIMKYADKLLRAKMKMKDDKTVLCALHIDFVDYIDRRFNRKVCEDLINFSVEPNPSQQLFNEYHSLPFVTLGKILMYYISNKGISNEEILNAIKANIGYSRFPEKRISQAEGLLARFEACAENLLINSVAREFEDLIPLSTLEMQWLNNIINDPMCYYFFDEEDEGIEYLRELLKDVPTFSFSSVSIFDQFINTNTFYNQNREMLSDLLKAMNKQCKVMITYLSSKNRREDGEPQTYECYPAYFEYSKRTNSFQLFSLKYSLFKEQKPFEEVSVLNLERMIRVELVEEKNYDIEIIKAKVDKLRKHQERQLVVIFTERNNIPDKILTEFSPWRKECCRYGENQYRMTLHYNYKDEYEIIVRLLGYGANIYIESDNGRVLEGLMQRVDKQVLLNQERPLTVSLGKGVK